MSDRKSTSALSLHCSGDMYAGLPMISPACVRIVPPVPPERFIFAMPKSRIFTRSPCGAAGVGHQKQVLGLQVAVNDPGSVRSRQGRPCLAGDVQGLRHRETPPVGQALLQRHPFEKLHQDVGRALGRHASVEDFDDIAMPDGAGRPRFVEKTPDQLRILRQRRVQDLDGGATFDQRILGKVHLPKTALAE